MGRSRPVARLTRRKAGRLASRLRLQLVEAAPLLCTGLIGYRAWRIAGEAGGTVV